MKARSHRVDQALNCCQTQMQGSQVYTCKTKCEGLKKCCHDTKNRCVTAIKNGQGKKVVQHICDLLQCLMVCENLCCYVCTCSCEHETISAHCCHEIVDQTERLRSCCDRVIKNAPGLSKELNLASLKTHCSNCIRASSSGLPKPPSSKN